MAEEQIGTFLLLRSSVIKIPITGSNYSTLKIITLDKSARKACNYPSHSFRTARLCWRGAESPLDSFIHGFYWTFVC